MLSPIDLETREFKKTAFGGYEREDIDQFMTMLFQDYKSLYMENVSLKDKINALTSAVTKYKSMEDILQNTLIVAQTTSDELKKSANDRAKLIVEEAENQSQKVLFSTEKKLGEIHLQLMSAQMQVSNYKRQMLALLQGLLDTVERIPEDTGVAAPDKEAIRDDSGKIE